MNTPLRRSRMRRTRGEKRITITPRDIDIFRLLATYRYLRSSYIEAFIGARSKTRFKERLGDLFHEGYLDRPEQQWEYANALCQPVVYELGAGGRRVLFECGQQSPPLRTFVAQTGQKQFKHALMTCDVLASIELAAGATENVHFIPWGEILSRAPEATRSSEMPFRFAASGGGDLIPDGLFGLRYQPQGRSLYRFFALEIDRATMPVKRTQRDQSSFLAKLDLYLRSLREQSHQVHFGISKMLVLVITTNTQHLTTMLDQLRGRDGSSWFLFQAVDACPTARPFVRPEKMPLSSPWLRAGATELSIRRP